MDYSPAETATPSTGGYTNSAPRAASWAGTDPQHLQFTSPTPSSQADTLEGCMQRLHRQVDKLQEDSWMLEAPRNTYN